MKDAKIQIAKPSLDLFGLLLTILRIRSKMGCKHECCSRMVVRIACMLCHTHAWMHPHTQLCIIELKCLAILNLIWEKRIWDVARIEALYS